MAKSTLLLALCASAAAWSPHPPRPRTTSSFRAADRSFDPAGLGSVESVPRDAASRSAAASAAAAPTTTARPEAILLAGALPLMLSPESAAATTAFAPNAVPSALAAYGHYLSLLGILGCIVTERLTIKPNMTPEEEDLIAAADIGLGLFGVVIAYTGYLRATAYEKGFDFYAHEPLFWLKVAFLGVFGAASFFNTIVIIQRSVAKRNGDFVPMGEKLAKRMVQICNAELVAVSVIPLTATFMARGVGYSRDFPWQAEAGLAALVFAGLSYKYVKEALTFEDDVPAKIGSSAAEE